MPNIKVKVSQAKCLLSKTAFKKKAICMCLCMCVYVLHVCMYVYIYICRCMYVFVCICGSMYKCMYMYAGVCMYVYMQECVYEQYVCMLLLILILDSYTLYDYNCFSKLVGLYFRAHTSGKECRSSEKQCRLRSLFRGDMS